MENWTGAGSAYGPDRWRGRGEFTSPDGLITLSVDYSEEDYHIDARPGHKAADMRVVLEQARVRGLEPMDADECEPELLEDGTVRIYLVLSEQPVVHVTPIAVQPRRSRKASAFAMAAALVIAALIPSPLRHFYPDMPTFGGGKPESITTPYRAPVTQTVHIQTRGN